MDVTTWPPPYKIRVSARVKHVQWRFNTVKGLELVVPANFKTNKANFYLEKHREWIEKITANYNFIQEVINLPDEIHFPAFAQTWQVRYLPLPSKKVKAYYRNNELVITINRENFADGKEILLKLLKKEAEKFLTPLLEHVSKLMNLPYKKVSYRIAKSRWGSCDKNKSISLNLHLLFLPENLIQHIMIHELSHTVHMNHSVRFWKLMAKFDENFAANKKALKSAQQFLPGWVL